MPFLLQKTIALEEKQVKASIAISMTYDIMQMVLQKIVVFIVFWLFRGDDKRSVFIMFFLSIRGDDN